MNKTTEALKLAEEALSQWKELSDWDHCNTPWDEDDDKALAAIREALANHSGGANEMVAEPAIPEWVDIDDYEEPVQEPVAWDELCKEKTSDNVDEWQYIEGWNDALDIAEQTVDAKAIRADALEEAAKVCEEPSYMQQRAKTSAECAAAIRGLK
jgi:hypothetical protein